MPELLAVAAVIIFLIAIMSLLEYAVRGKGSLFAGIATPRMRLLALLLGLVFAAIFVGMWIEAETISWTFFLVAIALIGYSLGAGALLRKIQGPPDADHAEPSADPITGESGEAPLAESAPILPLNRIGRILIILGIGSVLAALAIYLAMQAAVHPDHPLSMLLVIGIILFVAVAKLRSWIGSLIRR